MSERLQTKEDMFECVSPLHIAAKQNAKEKSFLLNEKAAYTVHDLILRGN